LPTEPNTVSHPTFFTPRVGALRAPTQGKMSIKKRSRAASPPARVCCRGATATAPLPLRPAPPRGRTAPAPPRSAPQPHCSVLRPHRSTPAPRPHRSRSAPPPPRDRSALPPGCTVPPACVLVCALAGGAVAPGCQVTRSAPSSSPAVPLAPLRDRRRSTFRRGPARFAHGTLARGALPRGQRCTRRRLVVGGRWISSLPRPATTVRGR